MLETYSPPKLPRPERIYQCTDTRTHEKFRFSTATVRKTSLECRILVDDEGITRGFCLSEAKFITCYEVTNAATS
jgi:hypothetical protein